MHHTERIVMIFCRRCRKGDFSFLDHLQVEAEQTREWRRRSFSPGDGTKILDAAHPARSRDARSGIVPRNVSCAIHEGDKIPFFQRLTLGAAPATLPSS